MTPEQRDIYDVRMDLGEAFGVNSGASVWACYLPPSGEGVTETPPLVLSGTRRLYIRQVKLSQWGVSAPGQPVGVVGWRMDGFVGEDIQAGMTVVNAGLAFTIGTLDLAQGFPSGLVTVTGVSPSTITYYFLLETGDALLLETADHLLLEAA